MNGFEYKKRYDPELGRYVKKHVHSGEIQAGGALTDIFKSVFGKTIKKTAKKALQTAATKTGEHVGKKAGDKITQLLRKNNEASQLFSQPSPFSQPSQVSLPSPKIPMSQYEINERVNRIISGGKFKKRKIINF